MRDIVFCCDQPICPKDGGTWGGTEATLKLVTEELANQGVDVMVVAHTQNPRTENGVEVRPIRDWQTPSKVKIFLRATKVSLTETQTAQNIWTWVHDAFQGLHTPPPVLANSLWTLHHTQSNTPFRLTGGYIHNPISIRPSARISPKNHLVWISAFQKGIDFALGVYLKLVTEHNIQMPLKIAVPKWSDQPFPYPDMLKNFPIEFLGSLDRQQCLELLATSSAHFRPSPYPETFGLVYAEAQALGVPTVTLDVGAAREILGPGNLILHPHDTDMVRKIAEWLKNPPDQIDPSFSDRFSTQNVGQQWLNMIEHPEQYKQPFMR